MPARILSENGEVAKHTGEKIAAALKTWADASRDKMLRALVRYGEATRPPFSISDPRGSWLSSSLAYKRKDKGVSRRKAWYARSVGC